MLESEILRDKPNLQRIIQGIDRNQKSPYE